MQMRDSTIFYRSFYEAIKELPKDNQAEIYNAIFEYSLNFKEIELSGVSKTVFILIKPLLSANIKNYENGGKAKTKRNGSETEAKQKRSGSQSGSNKDKDKDKDVNKDKDKDENEKQEKFIPPSYEEVWKYFYDNGYTAVAAKKAFDYYDASNWVDSRGNKVKNWKQKMIAVWFKDENKKEERGFVC